MSRVLGQHAGLATIARWLPGLDELPGHTDVSGADILSEARRAVP